MPPIIQTFLVLNVLLIALSQSALAAADYIDIPPAKAFDFPVGVPNAKGYYKARGFWPNGHVGEDWNGRGGGNTDLGDPVYAIGDGIVVQSRDLRLGWGNVIIIRHVFIQKNGTVKLLDSLYAHLDTRNVVLNQLVKRGQKIGTIGTNRGMYLAHLHFEARKNLAIGMHRMSFAKTYANYYSPTSFIRSHRQCQSSDKSYRVPINTFAPYPGAYPKPRNKNNPEIAIVSSENKKPQPIKPDSNKDSIVRQKNLLVKPKKVASKLNPKLREIITKPNIKKTPRTIDPPKKHTRLLARLRSRYPNTRSGSGKPKRSRFSPRSKR